jgi:hypothetical protein
MEIGVRANGSGGAFQTLNPRIRIASAPYAIAAANVIDGAVTATSLSPGPGANGQVLKMNNGVLTWADFGSGGTVTSVGTGQGLTGGPITTSGTLSVNPTVVPLLGGNQSFSGSNTFNGVSSLQNANNRFSGRFTGTFVGDGSSLTNISSTATNVSVTLGGDVTGPSGATTVTGIRSVNVAGTPPSTGQYLRFSGSSWTPSLVALGTDVSGTLADARLSSNVPLLNGNQSFSSSNTFSGVSLFSNANNRFVGAFVGDGSGLTNVAGGGGTATNVTLSGDVTGPSGSTTVAKIRGVNVSASAPASGQFLRYNGTAWTPGGVALGSDVSGTLGFANGGTAASTAAGARANLGAAASGANSDITSLNGLTTPLSAAQGGSGFSTYTQGDILYATSANTLGKRSLGAAGQVLAVSNNVPTWAPANNHDHFAQFWQGVAQDGLFVQNNSMVPYSAALTGVAPATNSTFSYGVYGETASIDGDAVRGYATGTGGTSAGIYGESLSPKGTGVYGVGSATGSTTNVVPVGVYGASFGSFGFGLYGFCYATSGVPVAVYGEVSGPAGWGFYTPNRIFVGSNAVISSISAGAINVSSNMTLATGSKLRIDPGTAGSPGLAFISSTAAGMFSPGSNIVSFATAGTERVRIAADGKVGIGRVSAVNKLEVEGDASKTSAGGWNANSDARIKTAIEELDHPLNTIEQIHPVSFRYTEEYRAEHPSLQNHRYYNVLAQEFAKVFPEAVKESGELLDGKPILQVDVYPATIYSIAAIQELHGLVKTKDTELSKLKEQNAALEKRLEALEKLVSGSK